MARAEGRPEPNHKLVYRVMKARGLLLQRHAGGVEARRHDGRIEIAMRAANRLDASAVMVNDPTIFRTDWMPFAGRGQSGYGTGGILFQCAT